VYNDLSFLIFEKKKAHLCVSFLVVSPIFLTYISVVSALDYSSFADFLHSQSYLLQEGHNEVFFCCIALSQPIPIRSNQVLLAPHSRGRLVNLGRLKSVPEDIQSIVNFQIAVQSCTLTTVIFKVSYSRRKQRSLQC
jgi:hypothetical protein